VALLLRRCTCLEYSWGESSLISFCSVYGILCTQVWRYYQLSFHKVDKFYKFLVAVVWLGETIDQAFIGHCVYFYTVTNYSNPLVLLVDKPIWTLILQMTVGATVGCMVKTAFSLRVWRLSNHNLVITTFLLLMTYAQLGLATWYTIKCFTFANLTELSKGKMIGSLALGSGVITDISIATALCYYLQKLRTEFSRSNALVRSLTVHAVDTGILTSAFSVATVILYNVNPNNFIFIAFYFMLSKLYSSAFLAAMNARQSVAQARSASEYRDARSADLETGLSSKLVVLSHARSSTRGHPHFSHESPTEIHMMVDVHQEVSNPHDGPWSALSTAK